MITFAISSGSTYHFILAHNNQAGARALCGEMGAYPIRIETIEEYNAITAIINADESKNNKDT